MLQNVRADQCTKVLLQEYVRSQKCEDTGNLKSDANEKVKHTPPYWRLWDKAISDEESTGKTEVAVISVCQ